MFEGEYTSIIKRTILFRHIWGVILGIFANFIHLNIGILSLNVLQYLSGAAIPIIMISLGLSLEVGGLKNYLGVASFISVIRLVVSPLIAISIIYIMGLTGLESKVTILESGMPSAMLSLVLAVNYELDIKAAAACIFLSTVLSMISLPILIYLI